jgi:hypothetical protein
MAYRTILALFSVLACTSLLYGDQGNAQFNNLTVNGVVTLTGLTTGTSGTVLCINGNVVYAGGCSGSGGTGVTTSGGTTGRVPVFTAPTNIENSSITDNGSVVSTTLPFTSSGNVTGAGYYVGATQIITSAPSIGNVVNIIGSGNLTMGGTVVANQVTVAGAASVNAIDAGGEIRAVGSGAVLATQDQTLGQDWNIYSNFGTLQFKYFTNPNAMTLGATGQLATTSTITAGGNISGTSYYVGATQIITTGPTPNIGNVGNIVGSGALTMTGNVSGASYYVGATQIVDTSRNIGNVANIINSGNTQTTGNLSVGGSVTLTGLTTGTGGTALCINANVVYSGGCVAGLSGSGTTNRISKWTGASTLGDSSITDNGTAITTAEAFTTTGNLSGNSIYIGSTQVITNSLNIGNVVNIVGSGNLTMTGTIQGGPIYSLGPGAALYTQDRTDSSYWALYGTSSIGRIYNSTNGDVITFDELGNTTVRGWLKSADGLPDIEQYGCTSGMSDATSCIQSAINANYGGGLRIPSGVWNVGTGGGHLTITNTITIIGDGAGSAIWRTGNLSASNAGLFDIINANNVRISNLWIDGETFSSTGVDYTTVSSPLQSNFTQNTTIWVHGGTNVKIDHILIQHTGGYATIIDATSASVNTVVLDNNTYQNNRPFLFGSGLDLSYGSWVGGVLIVSDGVSNNVQNFTASNNTMRCVSGHGMWIHATSGSSLLDKNMKFVNNHFQDMGLDGIQIGVSDGVVVANNNFLRNGYVSTSDNAVGVPKWFAITTSIPPVAIDSTNLTINFKYIDNVVLTYNGGCFDLDGAGYGAVQSNQCLVPFPGDPEYSDAQPSVWGPSNLLGQNWMFGVNTGNSNNTAFAGNLVEVTGNHFSGMGGGAIRFYAARFSRASENIIAPSTTEVRYYPITIGPKGSDTTNQVACVDEIANNNLTYIGSTAIPAVFEDAQYNAFSSGCINNVHDNRMIGNFNAQLRKDTNSNSIPYGGDTTTFGSPLQTSSTYRICNTATGTTAISCFLQQVANNGVDTIQQWYSPSGLVLQIDDAGRLSIGSGSSAALYINGGQLSDSGRNLSTGSVTASGNLFTSGVVTSTGIGTNTFTSSISTNGAFSALGNISAGGTLSGFSGSVSGSWSANNISTSLISASSYAGGAFAGAGVNTPSFGVTAAGFNPTGFTGATINIFVPGGINCGSAGSTIVVKGGVIVGCF